MEIPENDNKRDYRDEVTRRIISDLRDNNQAMYYRAAESLPIDIFIDVARDFVRKGYYAKVNHFTQTWKGIQSVVISKTPLRPTNARMVYSTMIL